jgi:4-carboxymuconolactone decarboxylase
MDSDMPTPLPQVSPLAPEHWDPSLNHIREDMNGVPIHVHQLMANNPTLLKAWWDFRNYSVDGGTLGKRKGELVILRVAVHVQAWYEWGSHVDRSLACGMTMKEINAVLNYPISNSWTEEEAALLTAVDELMLQRQLSKNTQARLAEYYDTAQVMDIMAIHGMYVILACMINTWGLELDAAVVERIQGQACEQQFLSAAKIFSAAIQA